MRLLPVLAVGDVVSLVNGYADAPRAAAGEQHLPYPDVDHLPGEFAARPRAEFVAAANEVYRVFVAAPGGTAPCALNRLLRAVAPLPVATEHGVRWSVRYARQALTGAAAVCLLDWSARHGFGRLGLCHGARCTDVYADASPAGARLFCSVTCLNRHKVAAHRDRARRRGKDGTG